jgi:hypothetical protein
VISRWGLGLPGIPVADQLSAIRPSRWQTRRLAWLRSRCPEVWPSVSCGRSGDCLNVSGRLIDHHPQDHTSRAHRVNPEEKPGSGTMISREASTQWSSVIVRCKRDPITENDDGCIGSPSPRELLPGPSCEPRRATWVGMMISLAESAQCSTVIVYCYRDPITENDDGRGPSTVSRQSPRPAKGALPGCTVCPS